MVFLQSINSEKSEIKQYEQAMEMKETIEHVFASQSYKICGMDNAENIYSYDDKGIVNTKVFWKKDSESFTIFDDQKFTTSVDSKSVHGGFTVTREIIPEYNCTRMQVTYQNIHDNFKSVLVFSNLNNTCHWIR
uniref:Uncharacterized protein n=1 Tax=Lepeophtheirus salmonis TaxID=72036 RepID=A0A0K2U5K3_LEPSM